MDVMIYNPVVKINIKVVIFSQTANPNHFFRAVAALVVAQEAVYVVVFVFLMAL